MPLKKVRFITKAKAIYPTHFKELKVTYNMSYFFNMSLIPKASSAIPVRELVT